ncbi:hypothetical protein [Methanobrevibacter arboriphilus]|nr:hypothetical protein [Methanobrevibacter arboriphilus]
MEFNNQKRLLIFLKELNYADMVTIGVASEKEAETDFKLLKDI